MTTLDNLRHPLRQLRKTPVFTLVCVLTLALGIGANTAVFSVMNAVLLRSLPVNDPQHVFYLHTSNPPKRASTIDWEDTFSYPVYQALSQQHGVLKDVIAYAALAPGKVSVRHGMEPAAAEGDMVSGSFFSGLGVPLLRGHGFSAEDEASHASVAVISYNYWTRQFSRAPDVLGRVFYVNGVPLTIVGVAAEGFEGVNPGRSTDFWVPLTDRAELNVLGNPPDNGKTYLHDPRWWCLHILVRLGGGVTHQQAIAQLQPTFQSAAYIGLGTPLQGEKTPVLTMSAAKSFPGYEDQYGRPLHMLMALVSLVLLIALSNVAMLLVSRNATRQREFSLRLALGARRNRLFQQLFIEGILLVALGGITAWLFAVASTHALAQWAHIESSLTPDRTVLLFTLSILLIASLIFALAPMRSALSAAPTLVLRTSAATASADAGKTRTGKAVIALQMALCLVLLVSAGLLIRTLRNLQSLPLGLRTEGLVVFGITPQNTHSLQEGLAFYRDLTDRLRVLPGVDSVTLMEERIGSGWSNNRNVTVDGHPALNGESSLARTNCVGPDFFQTLQVPILEGRDFSSSDTASSPHVAVVNELFVQRFLHNQNPIGHRIEVPNAPSGYSMTIVGVAKNHKYRSIDEAPIPMYWSAYTQEPTVGPMHVELRVHGDPLAILPSVQRAVQQINPNLSLIEPIAQREQYEQSISHQLLFARLAGFFGLLAVLLVATGLYGTLANRVANRTVEIGVRMAVGARRSQVVWMVLKESLLLTATGVAIGIPLASLAARSLSSTLFGIHPYSFLNYTLAIAGVLTVALIASAIPAQRAAATDPMKALRSE